VAPGIGGDATLDDLFRRAAARRPDGIALIDPPNRDVITEGAPRCLTYAQADRVVSALAGRLRRMGLHADAIVGFQIANTVESVLTLLAVLRAGLIAMPLPLLWRRADAVAALGSVGASALIVSGRVGNVDHFDLAVQVAADVFVVRYVCGFGSNAPDGVIALDDVFAADTVEALPSIEHERALPPGPAAHLAVITWDVAPDGLVPVARSHAELIAGGLAVLLEGGLGDDAVVLSTLMTSSFAGLAASVVPWLFVGGTLALHHPFDAETFVAQIRSTGCESVIIPGPLAAQFADAGHFTGCDRLKSVLGLWRAPERLARAAAWNGAAAAMVDVHVFGETGLIAARRAGDGKPAAIPFGTIAAPRGPEGGLAVAETKASPKGTVAIRGPMVPRYPFPAGVERTTVPHFKVAADGFVDTGYACQPVPLNGAMVVTAPPPGIVSVGGYRLLTRELEAAVAGVDRAGTLAALPDSLAGHRLAGSAPHRDQVEKALNERGVNPLLAGAFSLQNHESGISKPSES
jgi:non-ribosomal peptide synthetase component E (peptide arylation enzyme)